MPDGGTWRDLATLDLRLVENGRIVFWLRWFEDGDRFVELSTDGSTLTATSAFRPGFVLDEGATSSADGPDSPEVTLHLPLLATRGRSGGLTAEVSATDDQGGTQPFSASRFSATAAAASSCHVSTAVSRCRADGDVSGHGRAGRGSARGVHLAARERDHRLVGAEHLERVDEAVHAHRLRAAEAELDDLRGGEDLGQLGGRSRRRSRGGRPTAGP